MQVLKALKKWYRIAVFTASVRTYADTILNYLDPNNEVFEGRFYREHCTLAKCIHVKDLRLFLQENSKNENNWAMNEMVLIDNASHSFAFQLPNGFPMLPFFNDKTDAEMVHLYHYMRSLALSRENKIDFDMRTAMQSTFDLEKLLENKISEQIEGIVEYSVQEMSDEDFELLGDLDSETLKDKEEGKPTESVPEQRVIEQ